MLPPNRKEFDAKGKLVPRRAAKPAAAASSGDAAASMSAS
jgi:hypothetical protein